MDGQCAPCDRGKYRNSGMKDTTKCGPCPTGSYQNETGQASCLPCIPVSFHLLLPPSVFIIPVVLIFFLLNFLYNYFYIRVHFKSQLMPMSARNVRKTHFHQLKVEQLHVRNAHRGVLQSPEAHRAPRVLLVNVSQTMVRASHVIKVIFPTSPIQRHAICVSWEKLQRRKECPTALVVI